MKSSYRGDEVDMQIIITEQYVSFSGLRVFAKISSKFTVCCWK